MEIKVGRCLERSIATCTQSRSKHTHIYKCLHCCCWPNMVKLWGIGLWREGLNDQNNAHGLQAAVSLQLFPSARAQLPTSCSNYGVSWGHAKKLWKRHSIYIDSWVSQYAFMKQLIFKRLCFYAYGCSKNYDASGNIMKILMIVRKFWWSPEHSDDNQKILMIVRKL